MRRTSADRRPSAPALALVATVIIAAVVSLRPMLGGRSAAARDGDALAMEKPPARVPATPSLDFASLLPSPRLGSPLRVAIVREPATDAFHGSPARLDSALTAWTAALRSIGAEPRVVRADALQGAADADVLVIPAAAAMSGETRRALDAALAAGRGVLATGLAGTYAPNGRWTSYDFILDLTGAGRADTLDARPDQWIVFPSGSPLGADIPPGARIHLGSATNVALRAPGRAAYWSDMDLEPMPAGGAPLLDAAIVHGRHRAGRVVYWGFEIGDISDGSWNRDIGALLVRNSIAWAAGAPLAAIEPWPHGHRAAAAFTQDVEHEFTNARQAADTMRALGIRGTYFLVTDWAEAQREVAAELREVGEIGSHSENHVAFGRQPPATQTERLRRTQAQLRSLFGTTARGFRPPSEDYDDETLRAWVRAGGRYLFGTENPRSVSPEILAVGDTSLVLISRAFADDIAPYLQNDSVSRATFAKAYLDGYLKVRALGGLAMVSYHSQMLARPELVGALGLVARRIAADTATWIAPAGEIAAWWRARAALRVSAARTGDDAVRVRIENAGDAPVEGAVVALAMDGAREARSADGATLLPPDEDRARLLLGRIPAGGAVTVTLRLGARRVGDAR